MGAGPALPGPVLGLVQRGPARPARHQLGQRRRHLHAHRARPGGEPVHRDVRPPHRHRGRLPPRRRGGAAAHDVDRPRHHRVRHPDLGDAGLRRRHRARGGPRGRTRLVPLRRVRPRRTGNRAVARPHHPPGRRAELRRHRRRRPPTARRSHRRLPRELRDGRAGTGAEPAPDLLRARAAQRPRAGTRHPGPEVPRPGRSLRRHGVDLRPPGLRPVRQRRGPGRRRTGRTGRPRGVDRPGRHLQPDRQPAAGPRDAGSPTGV